ncbi:MAG: glycosyltransferase family 39 protein [Gammaproteobacteria bacterium]|nr:glycosyltransferase family 39 protein [Gammaproteobacteria bacterium]MBU1730707.1 glycosyltransferase family 39 protein [Gammaproteobacteria bacterium]MBU1893211.1 glycosyltransferase family 39 protein [Gammaproteobacteria bacterium]
MPPDISQSTRPAQRSLWLLLLAFALIWFSNLDYRHLVKPDEGRYAEIPREMVASGDWTTPRLNDIKYFEKPALQYWATATAYSLFGEHEWTARLWSGLTGFAGVLLAFLAGRRLFGADAGLNAALVLGSSFLYIGIGHINTLDMGVTFFMTLGLFGFLLAQHSTATPKENRVWMHITWAALACSVLSKGLIGMALPGAVLVLYTLIQRDWGLWKRLHLLSGLALFLLITAPWFIAVSLANPEFFQFFFIHEHFERFLTKTHGRFHPWHYFVPILLLGILPWLILMFESLFKAWKSESAQGFQPRRFLLIWALFIYFFFSISSSKLPSYILPIFPALALLIGDLLVKLDARQVFWRMLPVAILAAVGLIFSPFTVLFASDTVPLPLYEKYRLWIVAAAAIWLLGTAFALFFAWRQQLRRALIFFGFAGLIAFQLVLSGHESLAPSNSSNHLAEQIKPHLKPDMPFYSIDMYDQTLPFYLKRTFTLVDYQDELAFGLQQEPEKWIPDIPSFELKWRSDAYALAIMTPETFNSLRSHGLPMHEIARDTRRVVVRTP